MKKKTPFFFSRQGASSTPTREKNNGARTMTPKQKPSKGTAVTTPKQNPSKGTAVTQKKTKQNNICDDPKDNNSISSSTGDC